MKVRVYEVRAFTDGNLGGNAAGVVLGSEAGALTESQMLEVAARMGFSETAFVSESDQADFKVRFFTPLEEVNLCGHATLGVFKLLQHLGHLNGRTELVQETKAGLLKIRIAANEILMAQALPEFGQILEPDEIFWSLGLTEDDQAAGLPVQIVSTGLKDILVPVNSVKALREIKPDFEDIRNLSEAFGVTGYHCFALEPANDLSGETDGPAVTAWCRNFAPLFGIDEESATGTSNGALAAYLSAYGANKHAESAVSSDSRAYKHAENAVSSDSKAMSGDAGAIGEEIMRFAQGMWMGQPSVINARVIWSAGPAEALQPVHFPEGMEAQEEDQENPWVQSVWVGGSAVLVGETVLELL